MRTIILLAACIMLSACAAGINHNVVVVDNKPYLIESKIINILGLYQASEPPEYTDIINDMQNRAIFTEKARDITAMPPTNDEREECLYLLKRKIIRISEKDSAVQLDKCIRIVRSIKESKIIKE